MNPLWLLVLKLTVGLVLLVPVFRLVVWAALGCAWWIGGLRSDKAAFPCPVCGYDIRMTPHRCPECGTRLRWGILPREKDR